MNSDLLGQLAKERQRQLLCEAERERQDMRACEGRLSLSMRMRSRLSALLLSLSQAAQPHTPRHAQKARLTQSLG